MCGTVKQTIKNKTGIAAQIKFYKLMAVSAGLYGSENCILTEKYEHRIQVIRRRTPNFSECAAPWLALRAPPSRLASFRRMPSTLAVTRQYRLTTEANRKTLKENSLSDTISKYIQLV
jgi:hypothetical protein